MEPMQIASFLVRFQATSVHNERREKQWRIKVTHIQKDQETLFESIEDAMNYMKEIVENS